MADKQVFYATGHRKHATSKVRITLGNGNIKVNGLTPKEYFERDTLVMIIKQPLELTGLTNRLDINAEVFGGGKSGQAGALRHGITKAILEYNPDLRTILKRAGFITRDSRVKERKKYGLAGARRRYQFSKR